MTPQDLIAAFDTLAEAPDGVTRLRELVLQLAVRGKLVPQDPDDQPASVQVAASLAEIKRAVRAKELPKSKRAHPIPPGNEPHQVPDTWCWAPLGDLVAVLDFKREPIKSADRDARTAGKALDQLYPYYGATQQAGWIDDYIFDEELVLLGEDGAPFFKAGKHVAYIVSGKFWVNNHAHALRGLGALNGYLCNVLNQTDYDGLVTGTTRLKLTQAKMVQIPIPVPPLAEQKRIVARVDELMSLLDRLEAARNAREATRAALRDAALAALRDADTPEEVEVAWGRVAEQMDDLFTDPADVDPLRQTVLQLAVRGRLVPQDPGDEPASVLLERIAAEKARLVKEKKIGRPKPLPPVSDDEVPFEVPEGWVWARTQDLVTVLDPNPSHRYPDYVPDGVPLLSTREFDGIEGWDKRTADKSVPESFWEFQRDLCDFAPTDIIFARKGRLGLARPAPRDGRFTFSHTVFVVKVHSDAVPRCLLWLLRPDSVVQWLLDEMNSNTGVPTLGKAVLERMPLPVPPPAEQKRIVTRVDELMGLLDRLEKHLADRTTAHDAFAAAAVHHLES